MLPIGRTPIVKPVLPEEAGNRGEDSVSAACQRRILLSSLQFFEYRFSGSLDVADFRCRPQCTNATQQATFLKMGRLRQRIEFPSLLVRGGLLGRREIPVFGTAKQMQIPHTRAVGSLSLLDWQSPPYVDGAGDTAASQDLIYSRNGPAPVFIIFRVLPVT